jgi:putative transposase
MLFLLWLTVRLLTRLLLLPNGDDGTKDLEILVLRQQLRVLRRKSGPPRFTAGDRSCWLPPAGCSPTAVGIVSCYAPDAAALAPHAGPMEVGLRQEAHAWPATDRLRGRRARAADGEGESRWGCVRICGELRKLGIRVGATTIRALLRRHGLGPAPRRSGPTWAQFLRAQAEGIVACDLFTVETIRLKTLHVLFFIQLSTRRVVVAGVTAHPDSACGTIHRRAPTPPGAGPRAKAPVMFAGASSGWSPGSCSSCWNATTTRPWNCWASAEQLVKPSWLPTLGQRMRPAVLPGQRRHPQVREGGAGEQVVKAS